MDGHFLHFQQGFGMLLMEEAERIARDEHHSNKISVISGIKQLPDMIVKLFTACGIHTFHLQSHRSQSMSGNETSL